MKKMFQKGRRFVIMFFIFSNFQQWKEY